MGIETEYGISALGQGPGEEVVADAACRRKGCNLTAKLGWEHKGAKVGNRKI